MSVGLNRKRSAIAPSPKDWLWSDGELKLADEVLEEEVDIDTSHDIPYTAGYSKDGKTIYIDKEVEQYLKVASKESRLKTVEIDVHRTFAFHEMIEKSLEDTPYYLPYQLSHQIALRGEQALVESLGADWNDYNAKTLAMVDKIYKRKTFDNVPKNLDIEPYKDEEDWECLEKMGFGDVDHDEEEGE